MPLGEVRLLAVRRASGGSLFRHVMRGEAGGRACRDRVLVQDAGLRRGQRR